MRIRKKKWEDKELNRFQNYKQNPKDLKGKWQEVFSQISNEERKEKYSIHLEIGIGKGIFISKLAKKTKEDENIKYIGVDVEDTMLALTKRSLENEFFGITNEERDILFKEITKLTSDFRKENNMKYGQKIEEDMMNEYSRYILDRLSSRSKEIYYILENESYKSSNYKNVCITRLNADYISDFFAKEDNIERIYLNFSNPWPKDKHNKRRLTHPTKLNKYLEFLEGKKEIFFKTDDEELFVESREYFESCGFEEIACTFDLANNDIFESTNILKNIETEHEKMFKEENKNIHAGIYVYKGK